MMRMQKNAATIKRALLIFAIIIFVAMCIAGCGASADVGDKTEGMAESSFRRQMANAKATEIVVKKDLVLEAPVEVNGTKVLYGGGSITAIGDAWTGEDYMFVVQSGAQLTVKGSVCINADGITGGIHAAQGAVWTIEETACVKNASAGAANTLVEGQFQMNGGTMSDALGHNIYNKGEVTVSEGEIIGSGTKCAGIYSEGSLTQNGGSIRGAYNNVAVLSGSFDFNAGNNLDSVRDGIYVAEGAKLSVTSKDAAITGSGVRGIYLCGEATVDGITLSASVDSLMKISQSGKLNLKGGTLADAGYHGIENAGEMVMTGGSIRNSYNCGIVNTGTLEITGGSFLDNVKNKAVLNKHDGKATISGSSVMFSGNRFAVANEDTATMDLTKAEFLLSTTTNVYAYDGTVNIHDISLGASGSNNVRIYKAEVTMDNVQVLGNSKSGSNSTHGILLEGGMLEAKDVTIKNTTGYGIRNKGGQVTAENLLISNSIKAGGISALPQDYTGIPGAMVIKNLTIEDIRYNNIVVEGGTVTVTDGHLAASGTNNIKTTAGVLELTNVDILGNLPDTDGTNHAVYMTGGKIVAKNVNISDAKVSGLRINGETAEFIGEKVSIKNANKYGIDQTIGNIQISNLTMSDNYYNITNEKGVIKLSSSTLGPTVSNNVRSKGGLIDLQNVAVNGHTSDHVKNVHALFIDAGSLTGKNVTVRNVSNVGLRVKGGTTNLRALTVNDAGADGVWVSAGKVTLYDLEIKKAGGAGITVTETGNVSVIGGKINNTVSHGVKSENTAKLTLEDTSVSIATTDGRHAVLAQGGDIHLEDVKITGLEQNTTGFGIRINKDTSHVSGENISIADVNAGISANAGTSDLFGVTTENVAYHSAYASGTAKLVISDSTFGVTGTNNAKAESGGTLTLNNTVIEGTTANHGIMVEKGGYFNGKDITVRDTAGCAVRVKCSDEGNRVEIDGLVTENVGAQNVLLNKDENAANSGSVTIKNGDLCRTGTHNVRADAGNLTLVDTKIQGHKSGVANNVHAIYVCDKVAKVKLEGVTVLDAAGDALRIGAGDVVASNFTSEQSGRYGIWADGGKMTGANITVKNTGIGVYVTAKATMELNGADISGSTTNNINVTGVELIINGYADGSKSQIGTATADNVKASGTGVIRLNDVNVLASKANNVVAIDGGTVHMTNSAVTGGNHSVLAQDGKVTLNDVTICDSATSAIRANRAGSKVEATGVSIDGAKTGLSIQCGTVQISDITVRNTKEIGVSVAQSSADANVTLNNLVAENCGTHAIYTSGAAAMLTVNGATLRNDGSDHVINLNGGPMALNDVAINGENLAPGKYELYSGAGWLTIGGAMDADIYIATNPGRVIKVNKELTGNNLVVDWKNAPSGNALEFTSEDMMEACKDNITLGKTQTDAGSMLHYYMNGTKAVAVLVDNVISSEEELNIYLNLVAARGDTDVTILIGDSFEVANQVSIPASITGLTILDDGNTATGNTVTYTGSTDGLFVMHSGLTLTVNDISLASTQKVLLKQTCGTAELNNVTLSGKTSNIYVTDGTVRVNGGQIGTSTSDNVRAEGNGVIELKDVEILAAGANNVVAINGGTIRMTDSSVTGGGHSVLADKDGKVYLSNVSIKNSRTSGIRANHSGSVVEATNITIDGAKTGMSIKCGNVQITDITIRNTTEVGVSVAQSTSNAKVTLNNLVTENCGTHAIYTSGAAAMLTINGANLGNDGSDHVINLNGGPMALNDVTINGENLASGKYELYSGAGWLTIGGAMDANIYIATNPGRVIKVNKELTGNNLVVDWKSAPTGNALEFSNAAMMEASKDNIELGSTQAASNMFKFEGKVATLAPCTLVSSWSELSTKVSAQASGSKVTYRIAGNASDWAAGAAIAVPAGAEVTLFGDKNSPAIVVASGVSPFTLGANTVLTLENLTLGGTAEAKAAHIIVPASATLSLKNTTLQHFGSSHGGAVHVNNGNLIASGSTFANNSSSNWGGAIGIWGGSVNVSDSTFTGNTSKNSGGAIINYKADGGSLGGSKDNAVGTLTLTNCVFTKNTTSEHGGAVASWSGGTTTITGCSFESNSVTKNGGAIHVTDSHKATVANCTFTSNTSSADGGAIYHKSSVQMTVTGCSFTGNKGTEGGAISTVSNLLVSGTEFTENQSTTGRAGAVMMWNAPTVEINDCEFNSNTAKTNGGAVAKGGNSGGVLKIIDSDFEGNSANSEGGVLMLQSSPSVTITGSTFTGNSAKTNGGVIKNNSSTTAMKIENSEFTNNTAGGSGGVLYQQDGKAASLINCLFSGNTATSGNVVHSVGGTVTLTGGNIQEADCSGKYAIVKE